jgi:hypothetical protein
MKNKKYIYLLVEENIIELTGNCQRLVEDGQSIKKLENWPTLHRELDQFFLKCKKILRAWRIFFIVLLNLTRWVNFKTSQLISLSNSSLIKQCES